MVLELEPGMTGRWWVHTEYSTHLFDLDSQTYKRLLSANAMRKDQEELSLPERCITEWPKVGSVFQIIVSVAGDTNIATFRTSSQILSIEEAT